MLQNKREFFIFKVKLQNSAGIFGGFKQPGQPLYLIQFLQVALTGEVGGLFQTFFTGLIAVPCPDCLLSDFQLDILCAVFSVLTRRNGAGDAVEGIAPAYQVNGKGGLPALVMNCVGDVGIIFFVHKVEDILEHKPQRGFS